MAHQALRLAALGASVAALVSQPAVRTFLIRWSGIGAPSGMWRLLAILLALTNLKNLPFVWHLRFLRAFTYQLYFQPTPIPAKALFQPIVTSCRAPLMETDYNLHKSNSTYFSDMDISRTHLFTAIIRNAIRKSSSHWPGASEGTRGKHMIALGGISCNFRREILPYRKYEMWTRLLCWDRKWFYLVTHIVKPGIAKPKAWSLQPWRRGSVENGANVDAEKLKGAVYATAIAKYVVKEGRVTIPAEQVLVDADMVPVKLEGWVYTDDIREKTESGTNGNANGDTNAILPEEQETEEWSWDVIERERRRGLKFAEAFAELDGLHDVFDGGKEGALGTYPDLLWR